MSIRFAKSWILVFRILIGLLSAFLVLLLYLAFNPATLRGLVFSLDGVVEIPNLGPIPPPPLISAPPGNLPAGYLAFTGEFGGIEAGCNFLLELADGQRAGAGAAHTVQYLPVLIPARFRAPDGTIWATMQDPIGRGKMFNQEHFDHDYFLWSVSAVSKQTHFLEPDPRGQAQPGEEVLVLSRLDNGAGGSKSWPGVVLRISSEATWVQMEDSFDPRGYSGCPVVSRFTGRVIGMVIAGADLPPVVIGLHPIRSLVDKVEAALPSP
jgi:hypothetical protein